MYLNGGILKGAKYGQVSPKDYAGLKFWFKASNGPSFVRSNIVNYWSDLSGNDNHLSSNLAGYASAGQIYQTDLGPAYGGTTSTPRMECVNGAGAHKFLVDGSPYVVLVVFKTLTIITNVGSNALLGNVNAPRFELGQADAIVHRVHNDSDTIILNANLSGAVFAPTMNTNYILTCVNYGYGSGITPVATTSINEVVKGSVNFTAGPTISNPGGSFFINPNQKRNLYEVIIYNQTGKTKSQIDTEVSVLINGYIKAAYPNLY